MNERENEGCRKAAASDGGDAQDRSLSAQIAAQEPFERRPVLDTGDLEVAVPVARTDQQRAGDAKIDRLGTASTLQAAAGVLHPGGGRACSCRRCTTSSTRCTWARRWAANGLAATTVANPAMTAMVAVAMLVGVGGNALAAIKLGERKKRVAERVLGNSFVLLRGRHGVIAVDRRPSWRSTPSCAPRAPTAAVLPHARDLHDGHHRGLPACSSWRSA